MGHSLHVYIRLEWGIHWGSLIGAFAACLHTARVGHSLLGDGQRRGHHKLEWGIRYLEMVSGEDITSLSGAFAVRLRVARVGHSLGQLEWGIRCMSTYGSSGAFAA